MTSMSSESEQALAGPPPRKGFLGALAVFGERRTLVMLGLGFAAGLPNLLIFDTLSAWLRTDGLSLATIGFFGLATLTYALKFVWAPLVDRFPIPGLTRLLGHRRSWMLVTQALVIAGLCLIAGTNPSEELGRMALLAVFVGLAGATQDIVIDAWRIESVGLERQGAMAASYQWGYRVATIVAGAVPLVLADSYGWNLSYGVMAALMAVGVLSVFLAPREHAHRIRPIDTGGLPPNPAAEVVEWIVRGAVILVACLLAGVGLTGQADLLSAFVSPAFVEAFESRETGIFLQFPAVILGLSLLVLACLPAPGLRSRPGAYLRSAYGAPFADFFQRFGRLGGVILALICVYRLADFVLNLMNPFYVDLGFSLTEIAEVRKVFGVAMSILGIFLGGLSVTRFGMMRTMLVGVFMSPLSNLVFAWLATKGHDIPALMFAIGVDNIAAGYAGTALIVYMSSLTSVGFTATQYALFSSLYALPGKLLASQSGRIVEGSARAAEGGALAPLRDLVTGVTPGAYVAGAQTAGVSPPSLGAGYIAFFLYSTAIGVVAVVLAFMVAGRHQRLIDRQAAEAESAASG